MRIGYFPVPGQPQGSGAYPVKGTGKPIVQGDAAQSATFLSSAPSSDFIDAA
jgi:hypothetical protein